MLDHLSFDTTPICEDCEQVPYKDGGIKARKEAIAFINQLTRQFGTHPNVALCICTYPHDFGSYLSVNAVFDDKDKSAVDFVLNIEANTPEYWDEEARKELGLTLGIDR